MKTGLHWKFVLWAATSGLLLTALPVQAQKRSKACSADRASTACLLDIEPCMRRVIGNITKIPIDLGTHSAASLIKNPLKGLYNAAKSTGAIAQLFGSFLGPLKDMAEGALDGASNGSGNEIVTSSMVGFLKILLTITTDTHIRNDTNTIKTMEYVFPSLRNIDISLACAIRTMGGPQAWVLLPMSSVSNLVLLYLDHCFAVRDASPWCQFFNQVVPLGLKLTIVAVPIGSKLVDRITAMSIGVI